MQRADSIAKAAMQAKRNPPRGNPKKKIRNPKGKRGFGISDLGFRISDLGFRVVSWQPE
jgi:hypothetical protein